MSNMIQLNYDDLHKIVKTLNNEGDDTIQILSDTRQRVSRGGFLPIITSRLGSAPERYECDWCERS